MHSFFGGLEWGFLLGWLLTVQVRRFVYHQPIFRGWRSR